MSQSDKLNWLRAAVLGANDGIVSIAGLVVGVAGATSSEGAILTAGIAGILAGSISMAAGEYVSVSSARDTEKSLFDEEEYLLKHSPKTEVKKLTEFYEKKGVNEETAGIVAEELTVNVPVTVHFETEHDIDPDHFVNPLHAALASAASFLVGAVVPLVAILLPPEPVRIPIAFSSVVLALIVTGLISAKIGKANTVRATIRVVAGGVLAMVVTYTIGKFVALRGI